MSKNRKVIKIRPLFGFAVAMASTVACWAGAPVQMTKPAPRIVTIYNFCRNSDFRVSDAENVLLDATRQQIKLLKSAGLPATWALQYDAMVNPRYQQLLKTELGPRDEIAAWWEIPRVLAEKAGLKWRGRYDWDSAANVGFSPGYTQQERIKLVDVYMADFKSIFGHYPKTVGSWYIDEVTLAYMADRYHIVASCNCKDQVGTDGYTLSGGYWNQAYYPSKLNAYMPAQTREGQINVPIFRMLGSDPIYQYGPTRDMNTLEPVYPRAGGSADWVESFIQNLIDGPCLAFGFTQAGQENSFGWESMKTGLTLQVNLLAKQSRAGKINVDTLQQAGEWFAKQFPLTPSTAVVALQDWKHQGCKSVWYDSRFFRVNFLWDQQGLRIRDLHCFDEKVASSTHDTPLTRSYLTCDTLPVMDATLWPADEHHGIWPMRRLPTGEFVPMQPISVPTVEPLNPTDLRITQQIDGGSFSIVCEPQGLTFQAKDNNGNALAWALDMVGGDNQKSVVKAVSADTISYSYANANYQIRIPKDRGSVATVNDQTIRLTPNTSGDLYLRIEW